MARAFLLKLQPNQDVTHALERAVREAGMASARIVGAVGSLVEGVLLRGDSVERIAGPAIEVAALTGRVMATGGSRLHGYLCCADTSVAAGILVPGQNAVAVTFELLLAEDTP
jgi:predicted DNA-binding protein with PD1-like motif